MTHSYHSYDPGVGFVTICKWHPLWEFSHCKTVPFKNEGDTIFGATYKQSISNVLLIFHKFVIGDTTIDIRKNDNICKNTL